MITFPVVPAVVIPAVRGFQESWKLHPTRRLGGPEDLLTHQRTWKGVRSYQEAQTGVSADPDNELQFQVDTDESEDEHVRKLFILSPKFVVCNLLTAHTCTVTAYTHYSYLGTGREYIMSCSGSHEARRYNPHSKRSDDTGDV